MPKRSKRAAAAALALPPRGATSACRDVAPSPTRCGFSVPWCIPGVCLGLAWGLPEACLESAWGSPWAYLGMPRICLEAWGFLGPCQGPAWGLPGACLVFVWYMLRACLGLAWGPAWGLPGGLLGRTWGDIRAAWGVPEAALGCLGAGLGSSWCSWNASWRLGASGSGFGAILRPQGRPGTRFWVHFTRFESQKPVQKGTFFGVRQKYENIGKNLCFTMVFPGFWSAGASENQENSVSMPEQRAQDRLQTQNLSLHTHVGAISGVWEAIFGPRMLPRVFPEVQTQIQPRVNPRVNLGLH